MFCAMKRLKTIVAAAVMGVVLAGGLGAIARCQPFIEDTLIKKNAEGKIERLDGLVELLAIKQSVKLDNQTREKLKPRIVEWLLDVQQQVIDNLDFVAEIEPFDGSPGAFDVYDPANAKATERANTYGRQLGSPGTLINQLEFRRLLDTKQAQELRRLVYDYDQNVHREVMTLSNGEALASTRHLYRVANRDAMAMFHRLLDRAAGVIAQNAAALQLPESAAISSQVAAVKAAADKEAKRVAVKGLLKMLPLVQQRALFIKVKDLAPIKDPLEVI